MSSINSLLLCGLLLTGMACRTTGEHVEYRAVQSAKLGKEMPFTLMRAPATQGDSNDLPLFLLLHGGGDDHRSLDRFGLADHFWEAMVDGRMPRAHFVMPEGERGFYVNWRDGTRPYKDYILEEVLPAARKALGLNHRGRDHILGVSMGGTGALRIGLNHPERFASIGCLSGIILNKDQADRMMDNVFLRILLPIKRIWGDGNDERTRLSNDPYALTARRAPDLGQRLMVAVGSDESERLRNTAAAYHRALTQMQVEHEYLVFSGGHKWQDWKGVIEHAVRYALQ